MDPAYGAGPADLVDAAISAGQGAITESAGSWALSAPVESATAVARAGAVVPAVASVPAVAPVPAVAVVPAVMGEPGVLGEPIVAREPIMPGEHAVPGKPAVKCRVREVLGRIGDKWSIFIIFSLGNGPQRFTTLKRAIDGISQRMLTVTLRGLERDGIVSRTMYPVMPPRVDYALTPLGHTLLDAVGALMAWADEHLAEVDAARDAYDARSSSGLS
jgi:DNA-binding HxlR family transcriptional regulator